MSDAISKQTVDAIAALARAASEPRLVANGNTPYAVIPNDAKVVNLGDYIYNGHAERPQRIAASITVLDPESFIEYYTRFSDANSRIFAYEPSISVRAVLDYHAGDGTPRWCDHQLTLMLRASEEWAVWTGQNNRQLTQMQFAEFLEQHSIDIVTPQASHMLEVARDLNATTEVEFGSGTRTQDGQVKFKYTETTKASVGAGHLAVPEQFTIALPVFIGGPRIHMNALLRYRLKEGKLVLWYTLVRPEEVRRHAFYNARKQIADSLQVAIINGTVG